MENEKPCSPGNPCRRARAVGTLGQALGYLESDDIREYLLSIDVSLLTIESCVAALGAIGSMLERAERMEIERRADHA